MGRGRSSTNYNDAEKQLLLRAVASVKPRRASCWHAIETYYNAHRDPESRAATRDAHSLKRKFKSMASTRAPRNAEFEDPYITRARQLMAEMKTRMTAGGNASAMDDEDDDEEEEGNGDGEYARESIEQVDAPMAAAPAPVPSTAYAGPTQEDGRRLPLLSPLLPAPAPTPSPTRSTRPTASTSTSTRGSSGVISADLTQVLLLMREENAQREATRRAEREEAIAREERLRAEARELRRQEREEAAAREERHWRELAEQRRLDREDAAARHEQMMVVLAALLKPTAATTAAAADAITRASMRSNN